MNYAYRLAFDRRKKYLTKYLLSYLLSFFPITSVYYPLLSSGEVVYLRITYTKYLINN